MAAAPGAFRPRVVRVCLVGQSGAGKSTLAGRLAIDLGAVDARSLEKRRDELAAQCLPPDGALAALMYRRRQEFLEQRTVFPTDVRIDIGLSIPAASSDRTNGDDNDAPAAAGFHGFRPRSERGAARRPVRFPSILLVDAPGEKRFFKSFLRSCVAADVVLLVVSCRTTMDEEVLLSQLRALRALGTAEAVVAVTGVDGIDWAGANADGGRAGYGDGELVAGTRVAAERRRQVERVIETACRLLKASGFTRAAGFVVPVSGLRGHNVLEPWDDGLNLASWTGVSEISLIEALRRCIREAVLEVRTPVSTAELASTEFVFLAQAIYRIIGLPGILVLGLVASGSVRTGDVVRLAPPRHRAVAHTDSEVYECALCVQSIQQNWSDVTVAEPGDIVGVVLGLPDGTVDMRRFSLQATRRGDVVLASAKAADKLQCSPDFVADLVFGRPLPGAHHRRIMSGCELSLVVGTGQVPCRLDFFQCANGITMVGERVFARIRPLIPIQLAVFDDNPVLGRFVLCQGSRLVFFCRGVALGVCCFCWDFELSADNSVFMAGHQVLGWGKVVSVDGSTSPGFFTKSATR
jgi:translation elongation factor EF-1alpha